MVSPRRVEILDFYHMLERVGEVARVRYPGDVKQALTWQAAMKKELPEIGPRRLIREVESWEPPNAAGQEVGRVQLAYFQRQRERMRHLLSRRRGFPVGSSAVEGTCKQVAIARLRQSGMRWKVQTAEPALQLRAALLTQPRGDGPHPLRRLN